MGDPSSDIPFRLLFEQSLGAISVHTLILDDQGRPADYRFDAVNRAFEAATGLVAADILGKSIREVLPDTEEEWIERFGQVALTGKAESFTSYAKALGRWYAVSAFRHKPLGFTVSFIDVTDIKTAGDVVARSNQQFRTMVWNMSVGVLLQGPRAEILLGNPKAIELLGVTEDQLLGRTSFDPDWRAVRADGSDFPGSLHPVPQAIATKRPVNNVVLGVHRPRTADVVWLLVDAEPLLNTEGEVEQVICTFLDITDRLRAEDRWRESERRLERVLEGSQLGYWDWDLVTGIVHRNPRWAEMLGYTLEEIELNVGQWSDLHHPDDRDAAWQSIQRHLSGETPIHRLEYRMRCKDGRYKWILDQASVVLRDAKGKPLRMSGTHTDIDDQKRAEDEKTRLQAQLVQSQKMENLGLLAGGVAHDMNNVLAAILTLSSAKLLRLPTDDPHYHAFETICKAAERGGKMVRSLLEFSRQTPVEKKLLDLNTLVREEAQLLERTTFAGVRLELDLANDLRPIVGDSGALSHMLMNLCVNAVDAMESSGVLTLRTANGSDRSVELVVEDSGAGMTPEVLSRAMDPFFTTKPTGKGTGLGLSLAYSTVQAHHGTITLASQPGEGTTVTLQFPSAIEPKPAQAVPPAPPVAASPSSLTVLLVDDDELVLESVSGSLVAREVSVERAPSGEDAMAALRAGLRPDVIILDVNMPGMGGAGVLAELRGLLPSIPVFLSTGRTDQTALNLQAAYPGVRLLSKPYRMDELEALLAQVTPVLPTRDD